jgi:hypothetical protein
VSGGVKRRIGKKSEKCLLGSASMQEKDVYPGLNDLSDALEALPMEVIRHFTLLREIDAKCIVHVPTLNELIKKFFAYPDVQQLDEATRGEREQVMKQIGLLIKELMPCQEEKMHVAGVAAETIKRHLARIDYDYELIQDGEIPEEVQYGPYDHPAIIRKNNEKGGGQGGSSRSESRREAIAARKAQKEQQQDDKRPGNGPNSAATATTTSARGRVKGGRPPAQPQTQPPQLQFQQPQVSYPTQQQTQQPSEGKKRKAGEMDDGDEVSGSRPTTPRTRRRAAGNSSNNQSNDDEPVYCYCHQVSYGEMVGCDGPDCKNEWFHLPCIGLSSPPKGQWFCEDCAAKYRRRR